MVKYQTMEELGRGGMGVVYLARHAELGRLVALKVMLPEVLQDPIVLKRFKREAAAVARLAHPNVVRLLDHDVTSNPPWLAFEHVPGARSLLDFIGRGRPSLREALAILEDMAAGLAHIHEAGLVHRDLKPGNVLLDASKSPKIIDLGLARRVTADESRLTQAGQVIGTLAYMAPEQMLGGEVDSRGDVYSFGLIAYELLSGKLTFSSVAADAIPPPRRLMPGGIPPLRSIHKVPGALVRVLDRCLAVDAVDRPADGRALLAMLGAAESGDEPVTQSAPVLIPSGKTAALAGDRTRVTQAPVTQTSGGGRGIAPVAIALVAGALVAGGAVLTRVMLDRRAPVATASSPAAAVEAPPSLDLVAGRLHLRAATTLPVKLACTMLQRGQRVSVAEEAAPATDHDLVVGEAIWSDADEPRITSAPPLELPLGQALEGVAKQTIQVLDQLRAQADRTIQRRERGDAPSLAAMRLEPRSLAALRACAPWVRAVFGDPSVPSASRLKLYSAINRAQALDHLCPTRLAEGRGEVHALVPRALRGEVADERLGFGRLTASVSAAKPRRTRTVDVRGHAVKVIESAGPGIEMLSLVAVEPFLLGYRPDNPAARFLGAPAPKAEPPATGQLVLDIPPTMVAPGREVTLVVPRTCSGADDMFWLLETGSGLHAMMDGPCPAGKAAGGSDLAAIGGDPPAARRALPARSGQPAAVWMSKRLPAGFFTQGSNLVELRVDVPPWWAEKAALTVSAVHLLSTAKP